ncbi:hypothetical protein [Mycobacterium kubicae]|uniref:hypothetical protein n=1 Tax=Mycobacterium kubicae TaxID=120959 RepID=UPI0009EF48C9
MHVSRERSQSVRSSDQSADSIPRSPGLLLVAGAALAFVVCVLTFALGQVGIGLAAGIGSMLAFSAGLSWLSMDRRRIRDAERQRLPRRSRWVSAGQPGSARNCVRLT